MKAKHRHLPGPDAGSRVRTGHNLSQKRDTATTGCVPKRHVGFVQFWSLVCVGGYWAVMRSFPE